MAGAAYAHIDLTQLFIPKEIVRAKAKHFQNTAIYAYDSHIHCDTKTYKFNKFVLSNVLQTAISLLAILHKL